MNEPKSLIRHTLTALGTVVALIGLNGVVPIIDFLQSNLDPVYDAVEVLVGFAVMLYGFFRKRDPQPVDAS